MAAAITTTSTTLEGQLLEILSEVQALEATPSSNTSNRNFVSLTVNTDTSIATATVNLPISFAVGTSGKMEVTATSYLS